MDEGTEILDLLIYSHNAPLYELSSTDSNKKSPDSNGINLQNLNFLLTKRFNLKKTSNQSQTNIKSNICVI